MPEAGQTDYEVPDVWEDRLGEKQKLAATATVGEWANILMMPTYASLANKKDLTTNFRSAFLAITHDVMLRRLKKSAYKWAKETERAR